jgi:uncharacterized protein (TIGR02147 family)
MKPIFEYLDYRGFLSDYYRRQKEANYFFSYRYMSQKLGIDHSLIVKIFAGKRHLANKTIPAFIKFCRLSGKEADYFEALVRFTKAKSEREAKVYLERMLALKEYTSFSLEASQYEFYQKWYYSAVRALLDCITFDGDYALLAKSLNPPITPDQAKAAIDLLVKLHLIEQNQDGIYKPTSHHISSGNHWQSFAIAAFQKETIAMSAQSLDRDPRDTRDISSVTMSITREAFEEIRLILQECRSTIIKKVNEIPDGESDRVYQLNLQMIPLSRSPSIASSGRQGA